MAKYPESPAGSIELTDDELDAVVSGAMNSGTPSKRQLWRPQPKPKPKPESTPQPRWRTRPHGYRYPSWNS